MKKNNFTFHDKVVVRCPAFSLQFLIDILNDNSEEWIEKVINNKMLLLSILISSPAFHNEILNYFDYDEDKKYKIRLSLFKYVTRIATRVIPFGLFSGMGILQIGKNQNNNLVIEKAYAPAKLDSVFVYTLINKLKSNCTFSSNIKYFCNNTLYPFGDNSLRYIDFSLSDNGSINFSYSEVERDYILNEIIDLFHSGCTLKSGVHLLQQHGYSSADSNEFITTLIENNLLISEIEYNSVSEITIENHILSIIKRILEENEDKELRQYYLLITDILNNTDDLYNTDYSVLMDTYFRHNNQLLLSVDSFFSSNTFFPSNLLRQIRSGINVLYTISKQNLYYPEQKMSAFKEEFINRYEYTPQPLLEVLDVENGIGYDNLLNSGGMDNNPLTAKNPLLKENTNLPKNIKWTLFDSFIIRLIEKANRDDENIEIKDTHLNALEASREHIQSDQGSIRFSLYKEKNTNEPVLYLKHLAFTSLNKILGRFTLHNKKIESLFKSVTEQSNDNVIYAEVNHLVNTGMGNFLYRKSATEYVIDLIGNSQGYKKIDLKDLLITITGEKVNLYSKKLNKIVIPIFSNAYNYDYPISSPLFKFLLDIQSQYETDELFGIDTKKYLNFFRKIPRIQYKNIILSLQTWIVHINDFFDTKKDIKTAIKNFNTNASKIKLDRYFQIIQGDIEQLIDTNNPYSISIFLNELKKKNILIISEFLPFKYDNYTSLNNGEQLTNEFFIPLKFNSNKSIFSWKHLENSDIEQLKIPGSDCLYYKIYTGIKNSDALLLKIYNNLINNKKVKHFFFIKFQEKKHHIRLRIFTEHYQDVIATLYTILSEEIKYKRVSSVKIDSYNREMARYNYDKIVYFEQIFYHDSILSIKLIDFFEKNSISNKWLYSLPVLDILCNTFKLSIAQKKTLSQQMSISFANEFKAESNFWKFINNKYIKYNSLIFDIMGIYSQNELYQEFYKQTSPLVTCILSENEQINFKNIANIFHMHLTRVIGIKNNRITEFMLYEIYKKWLS